MFCLSEAHTGDFGVAFAADRPDDGVTEHRMVGTPALYDPEINATGRHLDLTDCSVRLLA